MGLDVRTDVFEKWMDLTGKLISDYYRDHEKRRVFAGMSPQEVRLLLDEPLPEHPTEFESLLDEVRDKILGTLTASTGPNFYGYITGGGNQVAVPAEMIKASINQNNLKWHSSPVSTEVERLVMRWVAEFTGYPPDSAGVLVSGGSVANFHCLAVARKIKAPVDVAVEGMYGSRPCTVYVSEEGHSSFDKAMDMLGLGKKYLRKIPVDDRMRIRPEALEEQVRADAGAGLHPLCAIAVAGTTNTGAVDDLNAVADICRQHDLWYHVDAAYGGPAAAVEEVAHLFDGIERADSLVVNPHKWLYVPFEAGGVLVKNPEHLRTTFSTIPDYLRSDRGGDGRTDLLEYNLPLTKEFKALKVWMSLKAFGAARIRREIARDIEKAAYIAEKITEHAELELMAPVPLSIVCFRFNPGGMDDDELDRLNDDIISNIEKEGRVFLTGTRIRGRTALRACFINHRTEKPHLDTLLDVVLELGRNV